MTSEEIRIEAQLLTGLQIKDVTSFIWAKDAAHTILRHHPLAAPKTTETVTIPEDDTEIQLSNEPVRIERITEADNGRQIRQNYWEADERGNILFHEKGQYKVTYRYVPDMPQTVSDAFQVPDIYLDPVKYYIAARMRGRIYGQNDSDALRYDALFDDELNKADISMERVNRRNRRIPPRY